MKRSSARREFWVIILGTLLCILVAFAVSRAEGAEDNIVRGFGPSHEAKAHDITIKGPTRTENVASLTFKLMGAPPLDIDKKGISLREQAPWLFEENERMFVYVFTPANECQSVDIGFNFAVTPDGMTLRPSLTIERDDGGKLDLGLWLLVVDWNHGQNQLVHHSFAVVGEEEDEDENDDEEEDEDEDDDVNPIFPPLSNLEAMILTEIDDQKKRETGVYLFQHIQALMSYLSPLISKTEQMDNSNPKWGKYTSSLEDLETPAIVLRDDRDDTVVAVVPFGVSKYATINSLKELGVK